jgi:phage terminase large subunit GpA-like protein
VLSKEFPGGVLILTGANSAVGLRSMPARYLFLDEVDGYPGDVEGEGDPILLAERRSATFQRRKILLVSTPKNRGLSRIQPVLPNLDPKRPLTALVFPQPTSFGSQSKVHLFWSYWCDQVKVTADLRPAHQPAGRELRRYRRSNRRRHFSAALQIGSSGKRPRLVAKDAPAPDVSRGPARHPR